VLSRRGAIGTTCDWLHGERAPESRAPRCRMPALSRRCSGSTWDPCHCWARTSIELTGQRPRHTTHVRASGDERRNCSEDQPAIARDQVAAGVVSLLGRTIAVGAPIPAEIELETDSGARLALGYAERPHSLIHVQRAQRMPTVATNLKSRAKFECGWLLSVVRRVT